MATTSQHMNARSDSDLLDRFVAAAEQLDIPNASDWVRANMGRLVNQKIDETQTVSDVHAYAWETREAYLENTPERPGANLGAVTDVHLNAAIASVQASTV